jgi:GNAT superfamily N-acetyltransferase
LSGDKYLLSFIQTLPDATEEWEAFCKLYLSEFPEWEREPLETIKARIQEGRYVLVVARKTAGQRIGFYILDQPHDPDYSILTFMAVAPEFRNQGFGSIICRHAFEHYTERDNHWLLIEAEQRQSQFYGRLGARCLDFEYSVPHFGDAGSSTAMYLMGLVKPVTPDEIDGDFLRIMVEHIFIEGYRVTLSDPCLIKQLKAIPKRVHTLRWPPE